MNMQLDPHVKAVFDDIIAHTPDIGPTPSGDVVHLEPARSHRGRRWLAVAAAAIIVVGMGALVVVQRPSSDPPDVAPATQAPAPVADLDPGGALPTTVPPVPTTVPPADISLEALADMAPPLRDIAGLSGKEVDVGQGLSIGVKTNVDEFKSQSDICLIVREHGAETGRLCADKESMGGLLFMVVPDQTSGRQVAFALVDSSLQIRSMADQRPEHVDLGGASAYFVDISSLAVAEGNVRLFSMVVVGSGINAQVLGRIPTMPVGSIAPTTMLAGPINYLAIGDSVMLGAAGVLTDRGYTVDAQASRQMIDTVEPMERLRDAGMFDEVVIIHVGTNGPFDKETLDAFLAPLSDVPNVIILNTHADRSWAATNNQLLAERDRPDDNIILIDWATLASQCPGECFADDGIHLNAEGRKYYAEVIREVTGL